jgi:secondary thiamine-phosphate synthase enzyme
MLRSASVASLASRRSQRFVVQTTRAPGFFDVTDRVAEIVRDSGITQGFALVFARHTTAAICINEHEPLLIADMEDWLAGLAPSNVSFRHDNFAIRTVNLTPDEKPNGHAHCKRLFLPSSEIVPIDDGELCLGRWQRVFLVELDCPRPREVIVKVLGI